MNDTLNREISSTLLKMRKSKGYSQQELADRLGIPRSTYATYEQGVRETSMEILMKVCDICGFDIAEVVEHLKRYAFK